MTVEAGAGRGPAALPDADELAAIVAVLESASEPPGDPGRPVRSRWREAALPFEADSF